MLPASAPQQKKINEKSCQRKLDSICPKVSEYLCYRTSITAPILPPKAENHSVDVIPTFLGGCRSSWTAIHGGEKIKKTIAFAGSVKGTIDSFCLVAPLCHSCHWHSWRFSRFWVFVVVVFLVIPLTGWTSVRLCIESSFNRAAWFSQATMPILSLWMSEGGKQKWPIRVVLDGVFVFLNSQQ